MPHGFGGVWMAVILGILSFNGIEVIAVTSGEAKDPVRAIPAALRTMALRLFLFYILALAIVVTFVPWTETGATVVTQSPFVRIFAHSGIRHAAGIMNFVVLSAALSSMNTNVYLCSRMLFSLVARRIRAAIPGPARQERHADRGHFGLGRLHSGGRRPLETDAARLQLLVRRRAVRRDDRVDHHLAQSSELPAQAQAGRPAGAHARISHVQIVGLALLCAVLVTMGLDKETWRISWIVGVPWLLLLSAALLHRAKRARAALPDRHAAARSSGRLAAEAGLQESSRASRLSIFPPETTAQTLVCA